MRRLAVVLALVSACSGPPAIPDAGIDAGNDAGNARAIFVLPRTGAEPFFDLPFPNDLRRTPEGTVDISTFPNPRNNPFVQRYIDAFAERLRGFGTNGAIYFRFSHGVDVSTLPVRPEDTLEGGASVVLVDVDPESPDAGALHPVVVHYQDAATRYWSAHTIAIRPVYGIPLASGRRYAAVITRRVKQTGGGDFTRDADFAALLGTGGDGDVAEARALYADTFTRLEAAGIPQDDILAVTVFTTQDAIGELVGMRDWLVEHYQVPEIVDMTIRSNMTTRQVVAGHYGPVPIFQEGEVPYQTEGGAIVLDEAGDPIVYGEYDAAFAIAIPKTPMPPNGYPIVLYAHGTGGDYESFLDDEGTWLPPLGYAVMGVDQIHHGDRNPLEGVDPSVLFFNFGNPDAGRDNNRQSALDVVQQARLVSTITIEGLPLRTEAVRFDPSRIYFMGHSQGGLNGPLYLAIDDSARAGVLSAASGIITSSLIEKTEPAPGIPALVQTLLSLPGSGYMEAFATEGFTVEHPIATLVQTWVEVSDGTNYAHMIFASPREGFAPKSILMTEGLLDTFSPPASIEALAAAMRVPQIEPVHSEIEALRVLGIEAFGAPASDNVAGGDATAGLLQFPEDGHFAIYRNDAAREHVLRFFESLLGGGRGAITAP